MQMGSPSQVVSQVGLQAEAAVAVAPSVVAVGVEASVLADVLADVLVAVVATVQQMERADPQPADALISARHAGPGAMQVPPAAVHALLSLAPDSEDATPASSAPW
jgi:hypothetical protein